MGEDPNNFLHGNRLRDAGQPWTWGYVIYRTVYTTESDAIWDSILSKLEAYMFREIDKKLWVDYTTLWPQNSHDSARQTPDAASFAEVREHIQHKVMDDKSLYDGLSIPQVRRKFLEFRELCTGSALLTLMWGMCLIIDQEVLHSIRDAPEPTRRCPEDIGQLSSPGQPFVKVVATTGLNPENGAYDGWMRCSLNYLWMLYITCRRTEMELIFPYHDLATGERDMYEGQALGFRAPSKTPQADITSPEPIFDVREVDRTAPIRSSLAELRAHYAQAGESEVPLHIENMQKMLEEDRRKIFERPEVQELMRRKGIDPDSLPRQL
ncbi:hypothetical protein FQN57_003545 [Myotisia sp. PD_48]|nr:hypothetical protein FQN57_003545 [Myotisia sp. PD_48]